MTSSNAAARLESAPKPPAFLDPLFGTDDCFYYAVPRFFDATHPTTSWLMKRIISGDVETLRRKLEFSPGSLRNRYFQVLDDPTVYVGDRLSGSPMFHNKCLLYLTPLGMCLYFKSMDTANLFMTFRTPTDELIAHPEEPQFASHLQDTAEGDFHSFVPYIIMMRREFFDAAVPLQLYGWEPNKPMAMPLRRRYERRVMYYRDWLDAALCLMNGRPGFPIASMVLAITSYQFYNYSRLPLEAVKPSGSGGPAKQRKAKPSGKKGPVEDPSLHLKHGAMGVDERPFSVPLVGAKSLIQLCEEYDKLMQTRSTAGEIRTLLREASAAGLNTEILMMQAEECIAADAKPESQNEGNSNSIAIGTTESVNNNSGGGKLRGNPAINSNNHARSAKNLPPEEREHCSEPLRVLLFSLSRGKCGSGRQQYLDAVGAYVRRNYFNCPQALAYEHCRSRDTRNVITCLLNVIAREQMAVDKLVARIRAGDRRWRSLENNKHLHTAIIAKVSGLMTSVLLSSKQIVSFLSAKTFPPYPPSTVDFSVNRRAASSMTTIRYGVVRDLNGCKDSWKYLTQDMLAEVVQDSAVLLHFKIGRKPTSAEMEEYRRLLDKRIREKDTKK